MKRSSFSRHVRIEGVARLLEGLEGVGVHHLGPHVAVIARGIAVAREDMGEMRGRVAHPDGVRHAQTRPAPRPASPSGRRAPRPRGTPDRPAPRRHIRPSRSPDRRSRPPAAAPASSSGIGCAGLRMAGVFFQHLGHLQPVLVKLARQFDEVARHRCAGNERIGHIRQHLVQRMAEFVEQRARVVIAQQRRLALPPAWRSCRR